MIMTQDKARKIAARQRMAETGEPYSVARHAVEREHEAADGVEDSITGEGLPQDREARDREAQDREAQAA